MDAGITDGRALGWTDHGVSKFGLQRQVLNTKDNSACCSSLAFILSPQVTAPQVLRSWETFHKDMFPPSIIYRHLSIPSSANARVSAEH